MSGQHGPDPAQAGPERIEDALARLARLHPKKIDLSLGRIARLLDALDRPQDRLPPVVHIAGTNGKGSTAAFLKAICEAAGESVHVYTSPHLVRFNERIVLNGEIVDDARLEDAFARCERANGDQPITFFEITTAAALLLFSETPADRVILETGLGGKFDATNVIERPAVCVITPVSHDHSEFLGDTLAGIAGEKAGILKPGVPAVIGPQEDEALRAIEAAAMRAGAPLTQWGRDYDGRLELGRLVYEAENLLWDLPLPGLRGEHQALNAAGAIAAARILGLDEKACREGVGAARWPARLQPITEGPLAEAGKRSGAAIWLDGGHNPAAGEVLAASLGQLEADEERPLILICAFSKNKDAHGYLQYFHGLAARVIAVTFAGGREGAASALDTAEAARRARIPAQTAAGLVEAIYDAGDEFERPRILICGSLYLAGEVLAMTEGHRPVHTPG